MLYDPAVHRQDNEGVAVGNEAHEYVSARRMLPNVLVVLACLGATLVLAGPLVNYTHLGSAIFGGDARLILWTLAWDSHAILHALPLFHANIFYPALEGLATNEHLFGLAVFFLPIYAVTGNPVLAYNLVWLVAWPFNALAAYAVARRYVRDRLASLVGGFIFAFSFYRMLHGHGHLGLMWTFWIPLSLLALEDWYRRPGWLRAAWLTFAVMMQVLTNWYLAILVLLADGLFLACLALFHGSDANVGQAAPTRRLAARRITQGLVALVFLFLALWPFARHYRGLETASAAEAASYSADATAYLVPPQNTWMGHRLTAAGFTAPRWIWGETTLYLGVVALVFTALGIVALAVPGFKRRFPQFPRAAAIFFPALGVVALLLSLGPLASHVPASWMPFTWLSKVPGLGGFRAPARFALLVVLAMSVLAAAGAAWMHRRFPVAGRIATLVLIPLMLSEWYLVAFPGGKPQPAPIPSVYRYLAHVPAHAVVSLPLGNESDWTREADYLYYSTAHWHPIVNGFGRTEPVGHRSVANNMRAFAGPNSARTMRRLGIDYVVLHSDRLPEGPVMLQEALQNQADFRLVNRDGHDYLFEVVPRDGEGEAPRR